MLTAVISEGIERALDFGRERWIASCCADSLGDFGHRSEREAECRALNLLIALQELWGVLRQKFYWVGAVAQKIQSTHSTLHAACESAPSVPLSLDDNDCPAVEGVAQSLDEEKEKKRASHAVMSWRMNLPIVLERGHQRQTGGYFLAQGCWLKYEAELLPRLGLREGDFQVPF